MKNVKKMVNDGKLTYQDLQKLGSANNCYARKKEELIQNLEELEKIDWSVIGQPEEEKEGKKEEETKKEKRELTRKEMLKFSKNAVGANSGKIIDGSFNFDIFCKRLLTHDKTLEKRVHIHNMAYHGKNKNNNLSELGKGWKSEITSKDGKDGAIVVITAKRAHHFMLFIPFAGKEINCKNKEGEEIIITQDNFLDHWQVLSNIGRTHRMAKFYAKQYNLQWLTIKSRGGKCYDTPTKLYYRYNLLEKSDKEGNLTGFDIKLGGMKGFTENVNSVNSTDDMEILREIWYDFLFRIDDLVNNDDFDYLMETAEEK